MKIFISYRFTGEDPTLLKTTLSSIQSTIEKNGHTNYCSFDWQTHFENKKFTNRQILEHSLHELEASDALLAFVNSSEKSEGMLLEIGYALAHKKKIYLLIRAGVQTVFVREFAEKIIEFENIKEFPILLKEI